MMYILWFLFVFAMANIGAWMRLNLSKLISKEPLEKTSTDKYYYIAFNILALIFYVSILYRRCMTTYRLSIKPSTTAYLTQGLSAIHKERIVWTLIQ